MRREHTVTGLDIRIARDVLDNDVWQDETGAWQEREYWPLPDGYGSSTRPLYCYSSEPLAAQDLRETIFRRTARTLRTHYTNPRGICEEALALNGAARYRPSQALIALIEASRWDVVAQWEGTIAEALVYTPFRERQPAIYIIRHYDEVLYVGQTGQGVYKRLKQHLNAKTIVGGYLRGMQGMEGSELTVFILRTYGHNSLNAAEQHHITVYQPRYNQQDVDR